jgi:hypothetical protein
MDLVLPAERLAGAGIESLFGCRSVLKVLDCLLGSKSTFQREQG